MPRADRRGRTVRSRSGSGLRRKVSWDRVLRGISIGLILLLVGGCAVLVLGLVMELKVLVVAFHLFVRLWPHEEEDPESQEKLTELVEEALEEAKPEPLSPEEYRRQRELAQKLIRDKAAPAIAKAIRGILRQDELKRRQR